MGSNHFSRLSIEPYSTYPTSRAPFVTYVPCSLPRSSDRSLSVSALLWIQLDFYLSFVILPVSPSSQIVLVTVSLVCCARSSSSFIPIANFAVGSSKSKLDHQLRVHLIIHYGDGFTKGEDFPCSVRMLYLYNT